MYLSYKLPDAPISKVVKDIELKVPKGMDCSEVKSFVVKKTDELPKNDFVLLYSDLIRLSVTSIDLNVCDLKAGNPTILYAFRLASQPMLTGQAQDEICFNVNRVMPAPERDLELITRNIEVLEHVQAEVAMLETVEIDGVSRRLLNLIGHLRQLTVNL